MARNLSQRDDNDLLAVMVDAPLKVCEQRDPKGLYKKARAGSIPNFTGISAPYEAPVNPEIHVHTGESSVAECIGQIVAYLGEHGYIETSLIDSQTA